MKYSDSRGNWERESPVPEALMAYMYYYRIMV